jgi:mRNA interferase MazF
MFRPGEIVIAAFPFTSLGATKWRPCLVIAICDTPGDFLVAFITSVPPRPAWRWVVPISPAHPGWRKTGLKSPSAVRVDKLTTLHTSVLRGAIGDLPDDLMQRVKDALKTWLAL